MRKVAMLGVVVLGTAGTVAFSASGASAASKCWVGSWKVTSASADISSPSLKFKFKGGKDIKLKLDKKGKATYNFSGSKPFVGSGTIPPGIPTTASLSLSKKLTMSYTVAGSAKGKLSGKPKTAKGNALLTVKAATGNQKIDIVKAVRQGGDFGVLPRKATYTCKGKTLTIKQKIKEKGLTSVTSWKARRA
ncbi:hypothetical protein [Actinocorallia longicatena]|uniref:Uncharacterized protein n=1 Tax=Actinocorallia longicatena TaxID=111803 RepID=A0ABP6QHA0_9ACTN